MTDRDIEIFRHHARVLQEMARQPVGVWPNSFGEMLVCFLVAAIIAAAAFAAAWWYVGL